MSRASRHPRWHGAVMALLFVLGAQTQLAVAEVPGRASPETVLLSDAMVADGLLSVSRFEGRGQVIEVLDALERDWRTVDLHPMRAQRDDWWSITRIEGEVIESIELRQLGDGHYEGQRIRWKHDSRVGAELQDDARWFQALLPARVRMQPPISHRDGERRSSTLVAFADSGVFRLDQWVERKLQRQGFRRVLTPGSPLPDRQAALYVRAHEEIALSLTRQGQAQVLVLHWRR